jgi:hypothetical protein
MILIMDDKALMKARNRFFPGWWIYNQGQTINPQNRPLYRVECETPFELRLAQQVKPSFIRAEIIYVPALPEIQRD